MAIHIGNKIKEVIQSKGLKITEFGRKIHKSRETVYSIYRRKTIDTGLLEQISLILEHDFFQYYNPLHTEKEESELQKLKEENALLKEHILLLKQRK